MNFKLDTRNLPDNLSTTSARDDFLGEVLQLMQDSAASVQATDPLFAAVVGMLVVDGYSDPSSSDFANGFWTVRGEAAGTSNTSNGAVLPNKTLYHDVAQKIAAFPGHKNNNSLVYFQELAVVSRKLLEDIEAVPADSPAFAGQIRVYDDEYVAEGPIGDVLDLPILSGPAAAASLDDAKPPNIRAVGGVLLSYCLDQCRFFEVADYWTMKWWNGQFPTGFDRASKLFDDFYWTSELRLTDPARHMQYARVLGVPWGEVSTEVQPNTEFMPNLMRHVATWTEFDRQQRVGDIIGSQRSSALSLTAEEIRQSGLNLAANASLYGWGGTQFALRRIADHINKVFAIYNDPGVQNALGVVGPWQVLEKGAAEIGATPNFVKWRTMGDAGKKLMDLVAKYAPVWSGSSGRPLVNDPSSNGAQTTAAVETGFDAVTKSIDNLTKIVADATSAKTHAASHPAATGSSSSALTASSIAASTADISDSDRDEFLRLAGAFLTVQGIKDDARLQLSQPTEAQFAPSIPTLAPSANGSNGSNGAGGIDQLRQMVSQGQVPSLDQLKSLVLPGVQ